jgi:hypothetical protein
LPRGLIGPVLLCNKRFAQCGFGRVVASLGQSIDAPLARLIAVAGHGVLRTAARRADPEKHRRRSGRDDVRHQPMISRIETVVAEMTLSAHVILRHRFDRDEGAGHRVELLQHAVAADGLRAIIGAERDHDKALPRVACRHHPIGGLEPQLAVCDPRQAGADQAATVPGNHQAEAWVVGLMGEFGNGHRAAKID